MENLYQRIRDYWQSQSMTIAPGVRKGQLTRFKRRFGVIMPSEMEEYFLCLNGMGSRDTVDDDLFWFWPLDAVEMASFKSAECTNVKMDKYFTFADYSCSLQEYAINLCGQSSLYGSVIAILRDRSGDEVNELNCSFCEFLERYLQSEESRLKLGAGFY